MAKLFKFFCFFLIVLIMASGCDHSPDNSLSVEFTDVDFPATEQAVNAETAATIAQLSNEIQAIINADPHTFENTILAYDRLTYKGYRLYNKLLLLSTLAPENELREAATTNLLQVATWALEAQNNEELLEVFSLFLGYEKNYFGEERKILEEVLALLKYDKETRAQLAAYKYQAERLKLEISAYLSSGDPEQKIPELFIEYIRVLTARANLMGWESVGQREIAGMMAKTPATAKAFVQEIADRTDPSIQALVNQMTTIKIAETADPDAQVDFTDYFNYFSSWVEEQYQISDFGSRYYSEGVFALEQVLAALFTISEDVFGIHLEPVSAKSVWDESVTYFEATDIKTGEPLGSLYLDLYDRSGKLGNIRLAPLLGAYLFEGVYSRPVNIIVANFNQPQNGVPVLLSRENAKSLFHEFGHFLNYICAPNHYYFSKKSAKPDYGELMSQLLERWLDDPSVIDILVEGQPVLSRQEEERWQQAIRYQNMLQNKYTIALSMFGLQLFSDFSVADPIDLYAIDNDIMRDYFFPRPESSTHVIQAIFNHVSYPGTYYGYLWSDVIAEDIAQQFRQTDQGLMNAELGSRLRDIIYTNDYDSDAATDIEWFLGRPWNSEAFYQLFE